MLPVPLPGSLDGTASGESAAGGAGIAVIAHGNFLIFKIMGCQVTDMGS